MVKFSQAPICAKCGNRHYSSQPCKEHPPVDKDGLIDPVPLKRGRKRVYKDDAAKSRAYYRRKKGLPVE